MDESSMDVKNLNVPACLTIRHGDCTWLCTLSDDAL